MKETRGDGKKKSEKLFWEPIEISIDDIFYKDADYSFLVGSGISVDAPSNLPTGYQFMRTLLEHILPEEHVKPILELSHPNGGPKKTKGNFLRFEQLMGFLQESIDPDIHVLDVYAECTQPNFNHLFLAAMIKKGCPVFTTNFDGLIEYGLISLGINKKKINPVIDRETWEKNKIKGFLVYKLHGSLINVPTGEDIRSSIQATIEQIMQGKKRDIFVLEIWKMEKLQQVLKERDLIVIGYSGLDDFDIIPTIKTIKSKKRLIWVSHSANLNVDNAIIEVLTDKKNISNYNIFSNFEKHTGQLLIDFTKEGIRDNDLIFRVRVNTHSLLVYLWQKWPMPFKCPLNLKSESIPQSFEIKSITLNINNAFSWFLLGKIWNAFGYLEKALEAYKLSLDISEQLNDFKTKTMALENIGLILEVNGRLNEALEHFEKALAIDKEQKDLVGIATRLNLTGMILYHQGKFDKALVNHKKALDIFNQLNNVRGKASSLKLIGPILIGQGKLWEALANYKQALIIDEELGDIYMKASCLINIGFIFKESGDFDKALGYYKQALEINERLGDVLIKPTILSNISVIFIIQGKFGEALDYINRALVINEQIGDMNMKATLLSNIGGVFYQQGELKKALNYYKQSYTAFKEHGYDYQASRVTTVIRNIEEEISKDKIFRGWK